MSKPPTQPATKAAVAAPQLNENMELGSIDGPIDESAGSITTEITRSRTIMGASTADENTGSDPDIMHLAQIGDVGAMERLFAKGRYDAKYEDEQGVTPLHWASINNQYSMCKFLIEKGANVNKKGGESVGTPLHWATTRSHYYTVNLLLQHGADPLATDAQGYNTLHLSTFNGNVFLIIMLLHQGIPVDVPDAHGHTGLMWSAYLRFPQCVDLFLRWGANVHARDEIGYTALHWALVKGSTGCVQKLIEYGADRFARTDDGKTPATVAEELKTIPAWHKALRESGYDSDAQPVLPSFPGSSYFLQDKTVFLTRFLFFWPWLVVWATLWIIANMTVFVGVPISFLVGYSLQHAAQSLMKYGPSDLRHLHKTVGSCCLLFRVYSN